ncbi:hypothetical protein ACF3OF_01540 [Sneathia vaginalis]|uniref:hypothetical protein n=1 Tax=Sneathia vaginalis TaxID=187101 RepID=UPI00370D6C16
MLANPFELLYASSLISKDPEFFTKYKKGLEVAKKAFENAQKTLKNTTEADKTAYENAVKEYDQLVADVKADLDSKVTAKKTTYDAVGASNKETAKKAYDKQVEINGYEKELADLNAKQTALTNLIADFNSASKEELKNTVTQLAEVKKITDQITALETKKNTAVTELGQITGDGKDAGVNYAKAQYDKDSFTEESFKSVQNTTKYKKNDATKKYEVSTDGACRNSKCFLSKNSNSIRKCFSNSKWI